MGTLIEGKVAQILSENHIVITAGSDAGVVPGMAFVVLAQGDEVKDPQTGEVLGRWEMPKGYVRVTHVQARISTCEGFRPGGELPAEDRSTQVLSAAMITASMRPETWGGGSSARLDVNRGEMAGMPNIRPISVGDTVRQMPLAATEEGK